MLHFLLSGDKAKKFFCVLAFVVFGAMMFVATRVGTGGDEILDGGNGKHSLNYFCTGDTTFANYDTVYDVRHDHMKYYGPGFELIPAAVVKVFDAGRYEFLIRHVLTGIFGFVLLLFIGLSARELKDWKLGAVALALAALTPPVFGLSFNDSKDIPMAAGFAISAFFSLRIYKTLPAIRWQDALGFLIGLAIAVSIRIGGLLIPFYYGVGFLLAFLFRKELRDIIRKGKWGVVLKAVAISAGMVAGGVLLGLCAYPNFFYEGPFTHVYNAITLVSKFFYRIPFLFEGEIVDSTAVPEFYLLKMYLFTIPLFVWLGIVAFVLLCLRIWKRYDKTGLVFFVFMTVFPTVYITLTDANVYNGWRHVLFMYSAFAVVAAIGLYELYYFLKNKYVRGVYCGVVGVLAFTVLFWMCSNYKYTYAYYNQLVPEPYLKYDIEYYETSCTKGYDWLRENVLEKAGKDQKFVIASKIFTPEFYAAALGDTNVKVVQLPFMGFAEADCDYFILTPQIIHPKVLKLFFPPKGTVHVEYVDDIPVCAVVEKKNKYDSHGIKALREGRFEEGMELLEKAYDYDPNNFGIWFWMGYGYFYQQKYKEAIQFFQKYSAFWPSGEQLRLAFAYSGQAFLELKQYDQAVQVLKQAEQMGGGENDKAFVYGNLALAYYNKKMFREAIPYLEKVCGVYPNLKQLLYSCYMETGDRQKAEALARS